MSPRAYRGEQRQVGAEQTRARILGAARDLLTASGGLSGFTVDAVARQADVARQTVYYQFGSKVGLLEALCDLLAAGGEMHLLAAAFRRPDPTEALAELIAAFGRFWASDRLAIRRLRGLAVLDPDLEQVLRARDERRREGVRVLVDRLVADGAGPPPDAAAALVDLLYTLTSFESFDTLAGPGRSPTDVTGVVQRLASAALRLGR